MKKLLLSVALLSLSTLLISQSKIKTDSLAGFDFIGANEHASHAKTDQQNTIF